MAVSIKSPNPKASTPKPTSATSSANLEALRLLVPRRFIYSGFLKEECKDLFKDDPAT